MSWASSWTSEVGCGAWAWLRLTIRGHNAACASSLAQAPPSWPSIVRPRLLHIGRAICSPVARIPLASQACSVSDFNDVIGIGPFLRIRLAVVAECHCCRRASRMPWRTSDLGAASCFVLLPISARPTSSSTMLTPHSARAQSSRSSSRHARSESFVLTMVLTSRSVPPTTAAFAGSPSSP
jgi:hypothetical protein